MPHGERVRGIKRNLALPGESNRRNIQGGVGQVQDQASPIVSEKALEQPLVKPRGLRGKSTVRREAPVEPFKTVANRSLLTTGPRGPQDIFPGVKTAKKIEPRQIGTSVLTEEGGVSTLRGTKPPTTEPQIDFTRGTATEVRVGKARKERAFIRTGGVRKGREGIDIFASAGRLAKSLASPEAQAERRLARGAAARRKGKRADVKLVNERIKALSSTLQNLSLEEGSEEMRNTITTQIADLISKGSTNTGDTVLNEATRFKKAGFSNEEITSILGRLGAVNAA